MYRKLLIIIFVATAACTKIDTTKLGVGVIPPVDNVHTFDTTLDVIANTYLSPNDTTLPKPSKNSVHALGYMNDPLLGTTKASIYVALKPGGFKFNFPYPKDSLIAFDSAVLVLSYSSIYYGDTNSNLSIRAFEITDPNFTPDTTKIFYTTSPNIIYNNTELGHAIFATKNLSQYRKLANGDSVVNQLRIPIDRNFVFNTLFNNKDSTNIYASDQAYTSVFKGFAIVPDMGMRNALAYFNLSDAINTKLEFYYRYKNGIVDTASTAFTSTFISAHANQIEHVYTGSEINNHLTINPTGDSLVYIQAAPGSYVRIATPALSGFAAAKGNVLVHRAELSMEQVYSTTASEKIFTPPPYLFLDAIDAASNQFITIPNDFQILSGTPNIAYFGGKAIPKLDTHNNSIASYAFNLSRYVQGIVTKNAPIYDLRLHLPYLITTLYSTLPANLLFNSVGDGRIRIGGTKHAAQKMKLHIIYSKL